MSRRDAGAIDAYVGARIRLRRTLLDMSLERLGDALGLSIQQVMKYERGVNRVSASRLFGLSHLLDVPIGFFFDGWQAAAPPWRADVSRSPETIELVDAYYRIADPAVRRSLLSLMKSIGSAG